MWRSRTANVCTFTPVTREERERDRDMTTATQTLLAEMLDAHGGMDRWHQFSKVRSTVVTGGFLWGMKGISLDDTPRVITSEFRRQWTRVEPFGQGDWRMLYQPHRVVIETQ